MPGDSFAAILAALAGSDLRDWSLPAVAVALGRPVERTATGRYVVAEPGDGLRIEVVADPDVDDPQATGAVYGVGLTPMGRDLGAALADAVTVLGPPPTVGGPGPWARWPGERVWWTVARSASSGAVRVFAEPAGRAAVDERRDFELGAVRSLPYLWRLDDTSLLAPGTWTPDGPVAATMRTVLGQLAPVCVSLADAVALPPVEVGEVGGLGIEIRGRRGRSVQCWFEPRRSALLVEGSWTEHPAGETGAYAVADAAAAAIGSWDVTKPARHLAHRALTDADRLLAVPGLGLSRTHG